MQKAILRLRATIAVVAAAHLPAAALEPVTVTSVDELTKTPLVLLRYKKGIWMKNITREKEEDVS